MLTNIAGHLRPGMYGFRRCAVRQATRDFLCSTVRRCVLTGEGQKKILKKFISTEEIFNQQSRSPCVRTAIRPFRPARDFFRPLVLPSHAIAGRRDGRSTAVSTSVSEGQKKGRPSFLGCLHRRERRLNGHGPNGLVADGCGLQSAAFVKKNARTWRADPLGNRSPLADTAMGGTQLFASVMSTAL